MSFLAITILASTLTCPATRFCDLNWSLPAALSGTVGEEWTITDFPVFDNEINILLEDGFVEFVYLGGLISASGPLAPNIGTISLLRDGPDTSATLTVVDVVSTPEPKRTSTVLALVGILGAVALRRKRSKVATAAL
jgi:hypothetical protein